MGPTSQHTDTEEPDTVEGLPALDSLLKRTAAADRRARGNALEVLSRVPVPLLVALLVVLGVVGFTGWRFVARPAPIEERMPMASEPEVLTPEPEPAEAEALVVHVAGAVNAAGLVELAAGARVADAVAAGGGLAAQADPTRLNLAAPLVDGARVYVPVVGEQVPAALEVGPAGASDAGVLGGAHVNINSADASELEELPGVGPATAAAIIEHREKQGPFAAVEELLDVRGIGEAKLEALLEHATVG